MAREKCLVVQHNLAKVYFLSSTFASKADVKMRKCCSGSCCTVQYSFIGVFYIFFLRSREVVTFVFPKLRNIFLRKEVGKEFFFVEKRWRRRKQCAEKGEEESRQRQGRQHSSFFLYSPTFLQSSRKQEAVSIQVKEKKDPQSCQNILCLSLGVHVEIRILTEARRTKETSASCGCGRTSHQADGEEELNAHDRNVHQMQQQQQQKTLQRAVLLVQRMTFHTLNGRKIVIIADGVGEGETLMKLWSF